MPFVNCDTDAFYLFRKLLDAKLYLCFFKVKNNLCNIKYQQILADYLLAVVLTPLFGSRKIHKKNFGSSALTVMNITAL